MDFDTLKKITKVRFSLRAYIIHTCSGKISNFHFFSFFFRQVHWVASQAPCYILTLPPDARCFYAFFFSRILGRLRYPDRRLDGVDVSLLTIHPLECSMARTQQARPQQASTAFRTTRHFICVLRQTTLFTGTAYPSSHRLLRRIAMTQCTNTRKEKTVHYCSLYLQWPQEDQPPLLLPAPSALRRLPAQALPPKQTNASRGQHKLSSVGIQFLSICILTY